LMTPPSTFAKCVSSAKELCSPHCIGITMPTVPKTRSAFIQQLLRRRVNGTQKATRTPVRNRLVR
jgi:hypothetical protein